MTNRGPINAFCLRSTVFHWPPKEVKPTVGRKVIQRTIKEVNNIVSSRLFSNYSANEQVKNGEIVPRILRDFRDSKAIPFYQG